MKKTLLAVLLLITMLTSAACSSKENTYAPKLLSKEGIAPYELSESDNYLLQSFGLDRNAQILSFNAPKEAISLRVNVYWLYSSGEWHCVAGNALSIGEERKPVGKLTGTLTTKLLDDHVIEYYINCGRIASNKTDELVLESEVSVQTFLSEFQNIELNKEIPIALVVDDSRATTPNFSLNDYFEPSKFEGMDFVQAVTVEFSDKSLVE